MAELSTLARPYAKAAFAYATEQQDTASGVEAWSTALANASAVVQDQAFADYLARPTLSYQQQVQAIVVVLAEQLGKVGAGFRNFLTQLAEHDRLSLLPEVSAEFELQKAKGLHETDVVIQTAFALSAEQQKALTDRLAVRFGTKINSQVEVKPELIAGVVIRAGDQVIDDSVLGKLEKLRTSLLAG
ncbi:MAG: F0F1 ATP synthase subunit delta [Gammaproteobacteria bacterium]|nr:F0F1 ATP synthase subunit delta [Gammaproteobacteria bacterium]